MEAGLEDVGWDGDGPVEDSGHAAGKQDAGNAELVVAVGGTKMTGSERPPGSAIQSKATNVGYLFPGGVRRFFSHS